jgi:cohesin loading factor subunit SCC2
MAELTRRQDPGLAVRKRVLKLLKGIFAATDSRDVKIDICCKMVGLVADRDENVKVSCVDLELADT